MSNVPTVKQSSSVAREMLKANKVQETLGGDVPFIRFDAKRTGEWLFGVDNEGVTDDVFALDLESLQHGYIQWHAKKPNRRMVPINQELPEPQEPIHYTDAKGKPQVDEASEARSFEGWFEDGTKFLFEGSTFGARKAIDSVFKLLFARAAADSAFIFPHVQLATDSYDHSQYGKVFTPELNVVAWYDEEGNPEPADGERLEAPSPESPDSDPQPAEEDPTPAPRRRKRKAA